MFSQTTNNLVENYSFESYSACPNNYGQFGLTGNWFNPTINSTIDFFSSCATNSIVVVPINAYGSQAALTGNNYVGIYVFSSDFTVREYLESQLTTKLKENKYYCVSYHVSLSEYSRYSISNLGVHFTSVPLKNYPPNIPADIYLNPHLENTTMLNDTSEWMKVSSVYLANGDEYYITIGNFKNDANTPKQQIKPLFSPTVAANIAYYYIDDISVIEINPAKAYATPMIITCANTTFTLGTDSTEDATYAWYPTTGLSCTNCPNPIITATANTKYVLTKQQCSATTKDSVYIQIYTPTLTATAGNFKNICSNDTVTLGRNDTTAFTNYQWLPVTGLSCTNCPQPVAMPFSTTTFTLNKNECALNTSDTVTIYVDDCEVKIPNIFTPNNDNSNDEWKIKLPLGFKFTAATVYDRWGTLVYEIEEEVLRSPLSRFRSVSWDGRTTAGLECSAGVYYYVLIYEDKKGDVRKANGTMILVR